MTLPSSNNPLHLLVPPSVPTSRNVDLYDITEANILQGDIEISQINPKSSIIVTGEVYTFNNCDYADN